jgi:hypothetical protein
MSFRGYPPKKKWIPQNNCKFSNVPGTHVRIRNLNESFPSSFLCIAGVEDVVADSKAHKVVVKGKKPAADPMKVVERVQKKTGRKVELLSPIPPPPPPEEEKKGEEKKEEPAPPKPEEKKEVKMELPRLILIPAFGTACDHHIAATDFDLVLVVRTSSSLKTDDLPVFGLILQPPVIAVVMKVHMHCEACAQEIKKRILKMKGAATKFRIL